MNIRFLVFVPSFLMLVQVVFAQNNIKQIEMVTTYGDTGIYTGPVVDGKADGKGTLLLKSGQKYNGNFKNGLRNGEGTFIWKDGAIYEGNWKNDKMNGLGAEKWADGTKYVGNFVNGHMKGQGIRYFTNGDRYVGSYGFFTNKPGQAGGLGIYYFANGAIWSGMWICDKLESGHKYPSKVTNSSASTSSPNSPSVCYTIIDSSYPTSKCGHKVSAYKIHCNKKNKDFIIAYFPELDCFNSPADWYYNYGGFSDSWMHVSSTKNFESFEEAAKYLCDCN